MRVWRRTRPPKDKAAGRKKTAGQVKPCQHHLEQWPEGYTSFRLDGEDVLQFGKGKPPLRIKG
jgi:hypothetical protein